MQTMLKRQLQKKFENLKSGQGLQSEKDNHHEGESSGKSAFASLVHADMQGLFKYL